METLIILALIAFDQLTKGLAERLIGTGNSVTIIPGFFDLTCSYNTGAAWGLLSNKTWGIVVLSLISFLVMAFLIHRLRFATGWKARTVLVMLIAGSAGNLIDRLRLGAVADFLTFTFGSYKFPSFNFADSLITVGAILLVIFTIQNLPFLNNIFGLPKDTKTSRRRKKSR
ncbi:MAG: signal peptidase II [Clostridiaceae bacterium]|jgi:signal peptidase II|nr:signal peptidase II [Clostridiaceae bacterium]